MGRVNVAKHAKKFLWALDKSSKTEMPKTEEEFIKLCTSTLRPIIRKQLRLYDGEAQPFVAEQMLMMEGGL